MWADALAWVAGLLSGLLAVPAVVLLLQVVAARRADRPAAAADTGTRPSLAVLVPAHNEAIGIEATLAALKAQLQPGDRLLVVADNCSDDTAERAEAAGAEVTRRSHAQLRGKGFALAWGLDHLMQGQACKVLVIMDADCQPATGALARLARRCVATQGPVQALYLMHAPEGAGLAQRMSAFAWRVKNRVRPRGAARLGWPCQLMGTGMAFPWGLLRAADLANGDLVEDMKLGLDLAWQGRPPCFEEAARVDSEFPSADRAARTQRTRWEHGHLSMILQQVPGMVWGALRRRDGRLLAMALDLAIPPLALLLALLLVMLGLGLAPGLWAGLWWPAALAGGAVAATGLAMVLAWQGWARDLIALSELLLAPWYVLRKLPIYLWFVIRRQTTWVRTDRQ